MFASIPTSTVLGVDGYPVTVESMTDRGLPNFFLVGLPDAACREARDRVRAAFTSSGLDWPEKKITINMAPSNIRKVGASFDLAIAIATLACVGWLKRHEIKGFGFVGELGLDGSIRPVDGIVPLVAAMEAETVVVPAASLAEASIVTSKRVLGIENLADCYAALKNRGEWLRQLDSAVAPLRTNDADMSDVRAQPLARWALEVAAAGGHNILMVGPPGSGKTMLAKRLPGILPPLGQEAALTATRIHSAAGLLSKKNPLVSEAPFRAPHHTASRVAISGGGSSSMRPGEVSLAHGGVLFLDEMAEFPRSILDVLRQPLEDGFINLARAQIQVTLPAQFLLVGATNPCPCGEGLIAGACSCSFSVRERYMGRLSGPLLDRFDIRIKVMRPEAEKFFSKDRSESSDSIRERVEFARLRAQARGVACNAQLSGKTLDQAVPLNSAAESVLKSRLEKGQLSPRGLDRIRRVALTLADLDASNIINEQHIFSALELRPRITTTNEEAA